MPPIPELPQFVRLARALEPWRDDLVIIGGWAHRLYLLHPHAQEVNHAPLMTLDADVAMPALLPPREQDIRQRLLAAGFTEELLGDDRPPATHYRLGAEPGTFYAEFLTPLSGSHYDRKGRRKATTAIGGVTSQQLRHLELLLESPWQVEIDPTAFAGRIRIANPVSFMAQKVLIHGRRDPDDRAKDILYIHDTLEIFGSRLDELRQEWEDNVAPRMHVRTATRVRKSTHQLFGAISDDVRRAARIPEDRRLSAENVADACRFGFETVFVQGRCSRGSRSPAW
jgi:hypothetical protein